MTVALTPLTDLMAQHTVLIRMLLRQLKRNHYKLRKAPHGPMMDLTASLLYNCSLPPTLFRRTT